MVKLINKLIPYLFYILLFFVPLVLFTKTSEVFEFSKIILTYLLTTLIISVWLIKMIKVKKIILRRTILDIPLLLFLAVQVITTITSIDPHTSLFGYYGRWHGGLISSFTYTLLYWAYVSNMDKAKSLKAIYILLVSGLLVSIYAVLQKFGVDEAVWEQDAVLRVFSTIGQPNWLAAWIVSLIPITWVLAFTSNSQFSISKQKSNIKSKILNKPYLWILLSQLFFLVLLLTKSRSGLVGFAIASVMFWPLVYWLSSIQKKLRRNIVVLFLILNTTYFILAILVGSNFSPSFIGSPKLTTNDLQPKTDLQGTESGDIRKLIWTGAVNTWEDNALLGTGPETFAYSFAKYKPVEHNLTSEWNFIYAKAHNEYLNIVANSGLLGLVSYLLLILSALYVMTRDLRLRIRDPKYDIQNTKYFIHVAILAGYISILATNFFGFSVVPIAINFFLFPAIAVSLDSGYKVLDVGLKKKNNSSQSIEMVAVLFVTILLLLAISQYWCGDLRYSKLKGSNAAGDYNQRLELINISGLMVPANYLNEAANTYSQQAVENFESNNISKAHEYEALAITAINEALSNFPNNPVLYKNAAAIYTILSEIDSKYMNSALEELLEAIPLAPNDPDLHYRIGLAYNRLGEIDKSIEYFERTIELKPNYKKPRITLALIYKNNEEYDKAQNQAKYVLENINPKDEDARKLIDNINSHP